MTSERQPTHTIETLTHGGQLRLALPAASTAVRPVAQQLPAQLRLDARTRQVGRAGIAEIRRILAEGAFDTAKAA